MKFPTPLNILLADDDKDDCFFFDKALSEIPIPTQLTTVRDGEKLMTYLSGNLKQLPDILFLDLNMHRKNGFECLIEIKRNKKLKHLPIIIYSTSLNNDVVDLFYKNGVHYYMRKTDLTELIKILHHIITLMIDKKFVCPSREEFIVNFGT